MDARDLGCVRQLERHTRGVQLCCDTKRHGREGAQRQARTVHDWTCYATIQARQQCPRLRCVSHAGKCDLNLDSTPPPHTHNPASRQHACCQPPEHVRACDDNERGQAMCLLTLERTARCEGKKTAHDVGAAKTCRLRSARQQILYNLTPRPRAERIKTEERPACCLQPGVRAR